MKWRRRELSYNIECVKQTVMPSKKGVFTDVLRDESVMRQRLQLRGASGRLPRGWETAARALVRAEMWSRLWREGLRGSSGAVEMRILSMPSGRCAASCG